jgi:hypothetical protein
MAEVKFSQLPRPAGLIEVESVLDIGAGLRPMGWYVPERHVCVEPHPPYADVLEAAGYETWRVNARDGLRLAGVEFDAIYLLDVIEHMDKEEGELVLRLARNRSPNQIVVATPVGFLAQEGDVWGMGGEYWQKHRSGWVPDEFPGWAISYYDNGAPQRGFIAVSP